MGKTMQAYQLSTYLAHKGNKVLVIDPPPMLGDELIMALVASDRIFIPTQAQDYSIDGLEELMQSFNVTPSIRNLVDMQESISLRKPVFLMGKKSKGKKDYNKLWHSLGL